MANKTVKIGRLPVYCDEWRLNGIDETGYHLYNQVSYFGSEFINMTEGNKQPPATLNYVDGLFVGYSINSGWKMLLNGYDSSIFIEGIKKGPNRIPYYVTTKDVN